MEKAMAEMAQRLGIKIKKSKETHKSKDFLSKHFRSLWIFGVTWFKIYHSVAFLYPFFCIVCALINFRQKAKGASSPEDEDCETHFSLWFMTEATTRQDIQQAEQTFIRKHFEYQFAHEADRLEAYRKEKMPFITIPCSTTESTSKKALYHKCNPKATETIKQMAQNLQGAQNQQSSNVVSKKSAPPQNRSNHQADKSWKARVRGDARKTVNAADESINLKVKILGRNNNPNEQQAGPFKIATGPASQSVQKLTFFQKGLRLTFNQADQIRCSQLEYVRKDGTTVSVDFKDIAELRLILKN